MNVNWMKTPIVSVDAHRLNQILDTLEAHGYTRAFPDKGKRAITAYDKLWRHYFTGSRTPYDITIYVYLVSDNCYRPIRYTTRRAKDNSIYCGGKEAFMRINNLVKADCGQSVQAIFGADPGVRYWEKIKSCVPAPISYANERCADRTLINFQKGDVSSAYPYEATKPLPTLRGAIEVKGIKNPTEEYPFAFYPGFGTLAIYNELRTDYFYNRAEYKYDGFPDPPFPGEYTILCKAADDNPLSRVFPILYRERYQNAVRKSWMNNFVGYCELNAAPILSHISAVIKARCVHRMLQLSDRISDAGGVTVLINTDSVAWIGPELPEIFDAEKRLGSFRCENVNCRAIISGPKKYQILDNDGVCRTVWAGVDREKQAMLDFGQARYMDTPQTLYRWDESDNRLHYIYLDEETGFETEGGRI